MERMEHPEARARVAEAGLVGERSTAEWVSHPSALEDLMRVMSGTSLHVIGAERRDLVRS